MEKRRLGKTNMEVSVVSLGGIPLQRLNQEQATDVIKQCLDLGINFIDTARAYSTSEEMIGNALEALGARDQVYIATKAMSKSYESMKEEIAISLRYLKVDYIDLYQVHNVKSVEAYEQIMSDEGAYRALLEAKAEGKIKHIGITGHSADIIIEFLDPKLFSTVQFPYNPIETQGEALFQKAVDNDMGTIVMKPIAGGAFDKGELSIKWILENKNISVLIPGMDSMEQVKTNIEATKSTLTDDERKIVNDLVAELGTEFCRRCGYCLPCPNGLDIPTLIIMESYLKRYDLGEWAQSRYDTFNVKASQCLKCGICETRCPYNLPIIKMLDSVATTFGA